MYPRHGSGVNHVFPHQTLPGMREIGKLTCEKAFYSTTQGIEPSGWQEKSEKKRKERKKTPLNCLLIPRAFSTPKVTGDERNRKANKQKQAKRHFTGRLEESSPVDDGKKSEKKRKEKKENPTTNCLVIPRAVLFGGESWSEIWWVNGLFSMGGGSLVSLVAHRQSGGREMDGQMIRRESPGMNADGCVCLSVCQVDMSIRTLLSRQARGMGGKINGK